MLTQFFLLNKNRTFPELDGVRACAIGMVFMSHAGSWLHNIMSDTPNVNPTSQALLDFVRLLPLFGSEGGGVGVDIFFVLSGFLIFATIFKNNPTFTTFIRNRFTRLFPVHAVLILTQMTSLNIIAMLLNLLMIVDFFPRYENVNLIAWTLGYELIFYVLAALWLIVMKKNKFLQSWLFLIMFMLLLLESQWVLTEPFKLFHLKYPDMSRFIAFIFGFALAKVYFQNHSKWKSLEKYVITGFIPALLLFTFLRYGHNSFLVQNTHGFFWKSVYAIILDSSLFLIFARLLINGDSTIKRFLRNKFVRIIGVVSYSMYLYHYTFALPMTKSMLAGISSTFLKMFIFIPLSFMITFIASVFLFHFLEKPYFLRKKS